MSLEGTCDGSVPGVVAAGSSETTETRDGSDSWCTWPGGDKLYDNQYDDELDDEQAVILGQDGTSCCS
jgi:hypothetical protein